MDVGLHLAERDAEQGRDVLVAHVLEMKEHQRHALMIGKTSERLVQFLTLLLHLEFRRRRISGGERRFITVGRLVADWRELAEQSPPPAVARQVVETRMARDRPQPSGR